MDSSPITPPPFKKRLLSEAMIVPEHAAGSGSGSAGTALIKRPSTAQVILLEQQIESLRAELEHERSLRSLDQTRAQQQQERLEQQVTMAVQEAAGAKELLDQWRQQSSKLTTQLRQARDAAVEQVQELQLQLDDAQVEAEEKSDDDDKARRYEQECVLLQTKLEAREAQQRELQDKLEQLQATILRQQQELASAATSAKLTDEQTTKLLEEAPPAVMKELFRVRTELAETQRRERQLQRQVQQSERRRQTLLEENQVALQASQRLPVVEAALETLQAQAAQYKAENDSWKDFGKRLGTQLRAWKVVTPQKQQRRGSHEHTAPPELATLVRFLDSAQKEASQAVAECTEWRNKYSAAQESIAAMEKMKQETNEKEQTWMKEKEELKQKLESTERQVALLQSKEGIYERETDSLRDLIKTFDDQLIRKGTSATTPGNALNAEAQSLQVRLNATREELQLMQSDRDRLSEEIESAAQARQKVEEELERVKSKFFKLRDALQTERTNKEKAEARAHAAEALAGKGSFDPERTRVFHLKETPLTQSLKEEIQVLQRQVEALKGRGGDAGKFGGPFVDPDKLNQRLKQNFKEQIALFREGVYLMTGYKVDMLPAGTERPTFRVRSMFAEKEDDHLMLQWPKKPDSCGVTSLDILNTDFAKVLATTPSYDYMTKFHSLPAFLSSVQLSLFEKQTVMM